jgi:hypothetical protein
MRTSLVLLARVPFEIYMYLSFNLEMDRGISDIGMVISHSDLRPDCGVKSGK